MLQKTEINNRMWVWCVDCITIIWLLAFICLSVVDSEVVVFICNVIVLLALPVFIVDLVLIYKKEVNFSTFIRRRWLDVILVIPYFRIFKILKFLKMAKVLKINKFVRFKKILNRARFFRKSKRLVNRINEKL